jgi:hypothetical protein
MAEYGQPVLGVIESMNGARFVHDNLEWAGWRVEIADAQKAKGLAPLACKTDRIDARVLGPSSNVVTWCRPSGCHPPSPGRAGTGTVAAASGAAPHGAEEPHPLGVALLWAPMPGLRSLRHRRPGTARQTGAARALGSDVEAAVGPIDIIDQQIGAIETKLRADGANHPYAPLLMTVPGVGWILGYTIVAELGDISRFASPSKLCGHTGLCPKVYQSGGKDHRGPLSKNWPKYLRWALIEAATHASSHAAYAQHYQRTAKRLGRQRGKKVARVELARTQAEAMWYMLRRQVPVAPARPTSAAA